MNSQNKFENLDFISHINRIRLSLLSMAKSDSFEKFNDKLDSVNKILEISVDLKLKNPIKYYKNFQPKVFDSINREPDFIDNKPLDLARSINANYGIYFARSEKSQIFSASSNEDRNGILSMLEIYKSVFLEFYDRRDFYRCLIIFESISEYIQIMTSKEDLSPIDGQGVDFENEIAAVINFYFDLIINLRDSNKREIESWFFLRVTLLWYLNSIFQLKFNYRYYYVINYRFYQLVQTFENCSNFDKLFDDFAEYLNTLHFQSRPYEDQVSIIGLIGREKYFNCTSEEINRLEELSSLVFIEPGIADNVSELNYIKGQIDKIFDLSVHLFETYEIKKIHSDALKTIAENNYKFFNLHKSIIVLLLYFEKDRLPIDRIYFSGRDGSNTIYPNNFFPVSSIAIILKFILGSYSMRIDFMDNTINKNRVGGSVNLISIWLYKYYITNSNFSISVTDKIIIKKWFSPQDCDWIIERLKTITTSFSEVESLLKLNSDKIDFPEYIINLSQEIISLKDVLISEFKIEKSDLDDFYANYKNVLFNDSKSFINLLKRNISSLDMVENNTDLGIIELKYSEFIQRVLFMKNSPQYSGKVSAQLAGNALDYLNFLLIRKLITIYKTINPGELHSFKLNNLIKEYNFDENKSYLSVNINLNYFLNKDFPDKTFDIHEAINRQLRSMFIFEFNKDDFGGIALKDGKLNEDIIKIFNSSTNVMEIYQERKRDFHQVFGAIDENSNEIEKIINTHFIFDVDFEFVFVPPRNQFKVIQISF